MAALYTLSGSKGNLGASHAKVARSGPGLTEAVPIYMNCVLVGFKGYCLVKGGEATASQLDLQSLTQWSVA